MYSDELPKTLRTTGNDDDDDDDVQQVAHQEQRDKAAVLVGSVECVPVTVRLPVIGPVTILEATAKSQEILVDRALSIEDDTTSSSTSSSSSSSSVVGSDPYGAVLWPASSAVAAHLLNHRHRLLRNHTTVLEVGAGTGLISIAAAIMGGSSNDEQQVNVIATDYEPIPLQLLQHAATYHNFIQQSSSSSSLSVWDTGRLRTNIFDLCNTIDYPDFPIFFDAVDDDDEIRRNTKSNNKSCGGTKIDNNNHNNKQNNNNNVVIVAADIMYEPNTGRAMAQRTIQALGMGYTVIIGDSPGRAGRSAFLETLRNGLRVRRRRVSNNDTDNNENDMNNNNNSSCCLLDFVNTPGWTVVGDRHELICSPGSPTIRINSVTGYPETLTVAIMELDPNIYQPHR